MSSNFEKMGKSYAAQVSYPTKTFHSKTYARIDPSTTTFDAAGKTILVTAGATGIGFEISRAFASTGVKRIIIVSRRPEPQQKAKQALESEFPNTTVDTFPVSVTDYAATAKILREAGPIDVLVICHAVAHSLHLPSRDIPLQEIRDCFDTNVIAPLNLVQAFLNLPSQAGVEKTVIHVSSSSAHMTLPGQIGYGASKAAFSKMLAYVADEQGETEGVRVFSFHPGALYTEAAAALLDEDVMPWDDIKLPAHFAVWLAGKESGFLHGKFCWAHWDVDEMIETFPAKMEKDPNFMKIGLVV